MSRFVQNEVLDRLLDELNSSNEPDKLRLIYGWIKQGYITPEEFEALITVEYGGPSISKRGINV